MSGNMQCGSTEWAAKNTHAPAVWLIPRISSRLSSFGLLSCRSSCVYVHLVRRVTVLAEDEATCYEEQANYMSIPARKHTQKKQTKNKQEIFFKIQKQKKQKIIFLSESNWHKASYIVSI